MPNYGTLLGKVTAVATGTVTIGGGTLVSLRNNDALYKGYEFQLLRKISRSRSVFRASI